MRQETKLELTIGEPDLEALHSVTREWLVPRLVEKFLRMHGAELRYPQNAENEETRLSAHVLGKETRKDAARRSQPKRQ
jgi:hypothetical protein